MNYAPNHTLISGKSPPPMTARLKHTQEFGYNLPFVKQVVKVNNYIDAGMNTFATDIH